MSYAMDFDAAAENYDEIRGPYAVDDMIRCMKERSGKQLSQFHVLDVGCGTGNYSVALLEAGVGKVSLFDASTGMLTVARKKMAKFDGQDRIGDIKQAVLPTIPFDDKKFDVVMINCVLHHLKVKNEDERSTIMTTVFRESERVLKENGLLLITTCYPENCPGTGTPISHRKLQRESPSASGHVIFLKNNIRERFWRNRLHHPFGSEMEKEILRSWRSAEC